MAALTNELDTLAITTKVKEILMAHNVGQKVTVSAINIITSIIVIICNTDNHRRHDHHHQ